MKIILLSALLITALFLTMPVVGSADQQPDMILEKMAVKLTRGGANVLTSIVEIPKQSVITVRELGGLGYLVGPIKGIGMTLYRGFIGMTEVVFFLVPQPGYYDPMIDPPYVWEGWEPKRDTTPSLPEEAK